MKFFLASIFMFLLFPSLSKAQFMEEPKCEMILKAQFKKAKLKICNQTLDVDIADNDVLRAFGLMCRESLGENNGMIFVFENERTLSFWMKNTKLPLSIGYLDKNKTLIDTYDLEPFSEKPVLSSKPAVYALETNRGWFKKNKIKAGCKFDFVTKGQ
ncbi:MAG: DUF192 domain-containing protein [Bdellovibrionota bacterium]